MVMAKVAQLQHQNVLEVIQDHFVSLVQSELLNMTLASVLVSLAKTNQTMLTTTK